MSQPLISIIIPLYNAERYIADAIESIVKQSYINWELIIVNDGSTDESLTTANEFASTKITIFDIPNAGAAAARNYGYQQSKGEYIKFFDADDLLSENMLEEQVNLAILNPDWLISSKWGRFYDDDLDTYREVREDCWQDLDSLTWIKSSWRNANAMTQPGIFLIPRGILKKAGLWNTTLSLIDDFEFFTRVILSSTTIKYCERASLYYRSGMRGNSLSGKKSAIHIKSAFNSIKLATEQLLAIDNGKLSRLCCANVWQNYIYEFYFIHPSSARLAVAEVKKLGGSDLLMPCGGVTKMLNKILGWKLTKRIKLIFKRH